MTTGVGCTEGLVWFGFGMWMRWPPSPKTEDKLQNKRKGGGKGVLSCV